MDNIKKSIESFLESLSYYRFDPATVNRYGRILLYRKDSFYKWLKGKGKNSLEEIHTDDALSYKELLLERLEINTVRVRVSAIRAFVHFCYEKGWFEVDWSKAITSPKPVKKEKKVVPDHVIKEVLCSNWGINSFALTRNRLIVSLLLRRGLSPIELQDMTEYDISPYEDTAIIDISGRGGRRRKVVLDKDTFRALKVFMLERAYYLYKKGLSSSHVLLSLNPRRGHVSITVSGIQAVVRRIKHELSLRGVQWDLTGLNPRGLRRTAVAHEFSQMKNSRVFTLSEQLRYPVHLAQEEHSNKEQLKNAYKMLFGSETLLGKFGFNGLKLEEL